MNIPWRLVYTCDFLWDFCHALQRNFRHKCNLAVISAQFWCNICCNFPNMATKLHQVSKIFETYMIFQWQITLLVCTCNFQHELRHNTNCIENYDKNCPKKLACVNHPLIKSLWNYYLRQCCRGFTSTLSILPWKALLKEKALNHFTDWSRLWALTVNGKIGTRWWSGKIT